MSNKVIVHHLNNSRSQRILWALEELEVPYEIKKYERDPKTFRAPKELKDVHPLGKSPVITDGDMVIAESGTILEYLADKFNTKVKLAPPMNTSKERVTYSYWLQYAESSFMPPLFVRFLFKKIESNENIPFFIRPLIRVIFRKVNESFTDIEIDNNLAFIEDTLTKNKWFCGENFTAADIQMSIPLQMTKSYMRDPQKYPHINSFLQKVEERPAYKRALEKGGEVDLTG